MNQHFATLTRNQGNGVTSATKMYLSDSDGAYYQGGTQFLSFSTKEKAQVRLTEYLSAGYIKS